MKPYSPKPYSQRALRSKKFNPDRKFQSWLENFNPDRNFQARSKISIPVFLLTGPSWCTEKGSIENFNPRSIARNFQSRRPRLNFFNPRALWVRPVSDRARCLKPCSPKPSLGRFQYRYPKSLFGLFLTFRVSSILQGYFWRPSEKTL